MSGWLFGRVGLAMWLALGLLSACDTASPADGSDGTCPYPAQTITAPAGKLHGEACTTSAECKYGICSKTTLQAAGSGAGVCVKQCNCGEGSQCTDDNDASRNASFTCVFAPSGGKKECAKFCKTNEECMAWNPELPFCTSGMSGQFQTGVKACSAAM